MKKIEIWKDIKDYEGLYQVSNYGRVKSLDRYVKGRRGILKEKILKVIFNKDNINKYGFVNLSKKSKSKTIRIHILVWDHFGTEKRDGIRLQVDHIDENKSNNHIDNLQLLKSRQNKSKGMEKYKTTSKYTGVFWQKGLNKWRSRFNIGKKCIHLGVFVNEYDAYLAYQKKLNDYNGYKN